MLFPKIEEVMRYFLYDLRDNPSLADIHLPVAKEEGPVLLLTNSDECIGLFTELTEMGENEGNDWLISVIFVPEHSPTNISDLLINTPYLLIAHYALVKEDPEDFCSQLLKMKKWVPN